MLPETRETKGLTAGGLRKPSGRTHPVVNKQAATHRQGRSCAPGVPPLLLLALPLSHIRPLLVLGGRRQRPSFLSLLLLRVLLGTHIPGFCSDPRALLPPPLGGTLPP